MRLARFAALLVFLSPAWVSAQNASEDDSSGDEQTLKAAYLTTDGAALVEFCKQRATVSVDAEKLGGLIKQLGDKEAEYRNKAAAQLVKIGAAAVPSDAVIERMRLP